MGKLNYDRRTFIKGLALAGTAAVCLPKTEIMASMPMSPRQKGKQNMVILFQGDSVTDGNRGRSLDPNHIMGHGYAFSIASRVGADRPEMNYQFYNRGISANKIIDLAARWQTDTLDLKPDILSILIGINDSSSMVTNWLPAVTVEEYEKIYRDLLDKTKAQFPDVIFVLCQPFIQPVGGIKDHWEEYCNDMHKRQAIVRKLADEYNAVFVEFQKVFDEACKDVPVNYWIWDGIHPTVAGHELMAREWLKQVEKRIKL